jgi:hypothetical protein
VHATKLEGGAEEVYGGHKGVIEWRKGTDCHCWPRSCADVREDLQYSSRNPYHHLTSKSVDQMTGKHEEAREALKGKLTKVGEETI